MSKYPELLTEMREVVGKVLTQAGLEERSVTLGHEIIEELRRHFGGEPLYFPKGCGYDIEQRNNAIIAKFNGHNYNALAREHGLSAREIYRIVERHVQKQQGDLFE